MSRKASVINLKPVKVVQDEENSMQLDSGRRIVVHSDDEGDLVQVVEPEGDVTLTIRMTDAGPVVTVQGAHLEIKSTETLTLEAKKINMSAREETIVESKGGLRIDAAKQMDIRSEDDIRVEGKVIHLN